MMARVPRSVRRRVGILVFDGVKMLDVAGPAEVFVEASDERAGYDLVFMSPEGTDVLTSTGARLAVSCSAAVGGDFDTVVIPGSDRAPATFVNDALLSAVTDLVSNTRRLVSICSGAFVLAELGLLDGRRAATH